ncbi:FtsX-like permease family protein [Streptosporangium sp. 'caverna']|uniref:FtsX-like permease family protein n=1 Tax=Streptosporangium sp. 'caverna' TaxID=2202249 RepID=UPI000D7DEBCB|nr:FtsX-like permease family protein [Streptosporangium sp. 'caverna']AWS46410.1 ABC transporter permease [Streptosporangium sp. 'caverna']
MSAFLAALRLSRRGIGRARARSALIIVMIGLPILALTAVLTVDVSRDIDPRERLTMDLGAADAKVTNRAAEPIRQDVTGDGWEPRRERPLRERSQAEIQAVIGSGRIIPMSEDIREYWNGTDYTSAGVREIDLRDPMAAGMFPLLRGRYPQTADEVVVTAFLKAEVGSTIRYTRDDVPKRVVGAVVKQPNRFGITLIGLPGSLIPVRTATAVEEPWAAERSWLVDTPAPITWNETRRINQAGVTVLSRAVLEDPPSVGDGPAQDIRGWLDSRGINALLVGVMGVTLAVIEVVLLAGPAFAVGLRRRRRELALISAQGGSARHLKLVVLADGLTLGLAAAVLGIAGGVGAARGITSYIGVWPLGEMGPFEVPAGQIALVAILGVFSGVAAAVVPAVQAARADVVAALTGRRAKVRDRAGWPLLGLILLVAGVGAMISGIRMADSVVLFGAVIGLLGLVMVTPRLVRLIGGLAGGLPLPFRLAARDASRNRGRTAPAIVAVLAAAAAFSAFTVGIASERRAFEEHYRMLYPMGATAVYGNDVTEESWKKIRPIVERVLPGVPLVKAYVPVDADGMVSFQQMDGACSRCMTSESGFGHLPAGGPDLLRLLLGRTDRAAETALAEGKMVIFNPKAVRDGRIRLNLSTWTADEPKERIVAVPAVVATVQGPFNVLGVMPVGAITKEGFTAKLSHLVVDPAVARLTREQEQRLSGPVRAITTKVAVRTERGSRRDERPDLILWVMAAFASVVVLGGTFTAAGLAAADARSDLDTLSAVGARPGTRRLVAAGQAAFIAGLGVPLGLLIGLVPGLALASQVSLRRDSMQEIGLNGVPFERMGVILSVPWPELLAVGIGLPLAVALIAMAFARTGTTLTRRMG